MLKQLVLLFAGASVALGQVSTVISDLNSIKSQTDSLTTALKNFDGTVAGGVPILTATNKLKTTIQGGITAANNAGTVSDSDQASVLKAAEKLYPSIIASLQAFVSQSSAFQKAGLSSTASQQLNSLASLSANLGNALASKATGDFKSAAQKLVSLINSAFASAKAGNSPQAQTLPMIPSGGSGSSMAPSSSKAPATSKPAATSAKASTYAAMSAPMSTPMSTPMATPTTPAPVSSAPASSAPAPAPTYTGAAGKVVSNVGGAVLLAAAAFAL